MKHGIERIISGTLEASADWVRHKPLLALVLALLLIKLFPKIAMALFVAIGIAVYRAVHKPAHLAIEVNPA
jgi:high-affinity K+ transport system ATPase subunit B